MTQNRSRPFAAESQAAAATDGKSSDTSVGFSKGYPAARISRRFLVSMLLCAVVLAIGIGLRQLPDLIWIAEREDWLRGRIATAPIACYAVGFVLYVGLSLIPGTAGKSIVFGWLFGFWVALLLVEIGLTAAAVMSFLAGRFLVQHLLNRRWQVYLRWINKTFKRHGAFYLLWLRMAHAPFTLVNYGAGAANIPLSTFWWTTHVGILPATLVYTFVGSRIPNIRAVAEQGVWAVVDPWLVAVLVALAFFPLLFRAWFQEGRH